MPETAMFSDSSVLSYATPASRAKESRGGPVPITPSPLSGGGGQPEEEPFISSVLDELHAEQKSTIEALTYQVVLFRKREERYKKEVETLRR